MFDIVFVILNYNLVDETIKCITSIRNRIDTPNYHIVIVDNGSKNDSAVQLKEKFANSSDITIVILKENIGFARGNNEGIRIAKELGTAFVCCLNDDTELISDNIFKTLKSKYKEYKPALIGPGILQPNGRLCNYNKYLHDLNWYRVRLELIREQKYRFSWKDWLIARLSRRKHLLELLYCVNNLIFHKDDVIIHNDTLGLILHGSCLFFTPTFFSELKGFNPTTFLYHEEEFLFADLRIHNLTTLYVPSIIILHKGGVATNSVTGKHLRKSWEFRHNAFLKSLEQLVDYLEENESLIYKNNIGCENNDVDMSTF